GVDPTGAHLFSVQAHGSTDVGYYQSLGSGSLAAMAILESQWKEDISKEEAIKLASDAIEAGICNDLGSGSNVDICVMEVGKDAILHRNYLTPNVREKKQRSYKFARGTTAILKESIHNLCEVQEVQEASEPVDHQNHAAIPETPELSEVDDMDVSMEDAEDSNNGTIRPEK
ncbi:hypothetical protein WICPIJ_004973, partial [Wickerhamomyces pijperi]